MNGENIHSRTKDIRNSEDLENVGLSFEAFRCAFIVVSCFYDNGFRADLRALTWPRIGFTRDEVMNQLTARSAIPYSCDRFPSYKGLSSSNGLDSSV